MTEETPVEETPAEEVVDETPVEETPNETPVEQPAPVDNTKMIKKLIIEYNQLSYKIKQGDILKQLLDLGFDQFEVSIES